MPLVRISLMQGKPAHYGKEVGKIVYQAMRSAIAIPAHDHFQVITEHDHDSLIYAPTYSDIERTDDFLLIQITLNEGRTTEAKKALYHPRDAQRDVTQQ